MFKWLDLIFPWGLTALTGGLATWVTVRGGAAVGALVSMWALFAVVIAGGAWLYTMRWRGRRCDYELGRVHVRLGVKNRPSRDDIWRWLVSVIAFWETDGYPATGHKLGTLVPGHCVQGLVVFDDRYKIELSRWDMIVHGWSKDGVAVIGIHPGMTAAEDGAYVASLFRHEVSHLILSACGIPGELHHGLFKKYGLGA